MKNVTLEWRWLGRTGQTSRRGRATWSGFLSGSLITNHDCACFVCVSPLCPHLLWDSCSLASCTLLRMQYTSPFLQKSPKSPPSSHLHRAQSASPLPLARPPNRLVSADPQQLSCQQRAPMSSTASPRPTRKLALSEPCVNPVSPKRQATSASANRKFS